MRGPMCAILSPIGFGLKTVTGTYSKGYKRGAKTAGILLALITPFSIVATLNGYNQFKFDSKQTQIGAAVYGVSLTTNLVGSLILGSKNKKMEKRINNYMDERYPYGIVIGYDRK